MTQRQKLREGVNREVRLGQPAGGRSATAGGGVLRKVPRGCQVLENLQIAFSCRDGSGGNCLPRRRTLLGGTGTASVQSHKGQEGTSPSLLLQPSVLRPAPPMTEPNRESGDRRNWVYSQSPIRLEPYKRVGLQLKENSIITDLFL